MTEAFLVRDSESPLRHIPHPQCCLHIRVSLRMRTSAAPLETCTTTAYPNTTHHAADLLIAAHDRIKLPVPSQPHDVGAVLGQRAVVVLLLGQHAQAAAAAAGRARGRADLAALEALDELLDGRVGGADLLQRGHHLRVPADGHKELRRGLHEDLSMNNKRENLLLNNTVFPN
jgi:hypothetical protein